MVTPVYHPPPAGELPFLHVSATLLVVDKPAGLLTVPGRGTDKADCLLARVRARFADAMIVHRLDMSTSGIVVLARGPAAQRVLSMLFQERRVTKRYEALVAGAWTEAAAGTIDLPLIADWPNRPRQKIDHGVGKPSLTRYRVLESDAARGIARVELEPVTGRSHQLRVHMEAAGHPILGDELYGTPASRAGAERLMLHACSIEFADPATGEIVRATSAAPF